MTATALRLCLESVFTIPVDVEQNLEDLHSAAFGSVKDGISQDVEVSQQEPVTLVRKLSTSMKVVVIDVDCFYLPPLTTSRFRFGIDAIVIYNLHERWYG